MNQKVRFWLDPAAAQAAGVVFEPPRDGDAGFDIRAAESIVLEDGAQQLIPTGLYLAIPDGFVGIIKDRSSMAVKRVYTHAGVIDSSYRGEVKIVLSNQSGASYHIERGGKIAQMVVVPALTTGEAVSDRDQLGSSERGSGGFGSTGS